MGEFQDWLNDPDYLKSVERMPASMTSPSVPASPPKPEPILPTKPEFGFARPLLKPKEEDKKNWISDPEYLKSVESQAITPVSLPERGVLGDIASSLARGIAVGIPQFTGQAITGIGALTGIEPIKETGRTITGFAEKLPEQYPFLAPSTAETESSFRRFITGMGENIPVILGAAKMGAAIGSVVPGAGTALGSILGGLAGIFGTFGLAAKGRAYDQAISEGLSEEEAQNYSNKIGTIEGGVWSLLAPIERVTGGIAGRFIKKPVIETIQKLLKPTLKESLTGLAIEVPAVTAAGTTSAYLQAKAAQEAGIPTPTPEEAAYEAIAPSIGISILFGLGTRGLAWRERQAIFTSLKNPAVEPELRNKAADIVFRNLKRFDTEIANMWRREVNYSIQNKKEIPIDEDYMNWIRRGQTERLPVKWGTPGAELPVSIEEIPQSPPKIYFGEDFIMYPPQLKEAMELKPEPESISPPTK